jgi:hypothetical protein
LLADGLERLHPLTQRGNLVLQLLHLGRCALLLGLIGLVESLQIACDARLDLRHLLGQLGSGEVALVAVDGLELGPVERDLAASEQPKAAAQEDELAAGVADRLSVVTPEVGQGLEVRRELAGQPDQLEIATSLALEATARRHPVQVAIEIDLEQDSRMVSGSACGGRLGAGKAQGQQIKFIDESIDHPHRIILRDVVVQAFRQEDRLSAVLAFDEAGHRGLPELGESLPNQPVPTQPPQQSGSCASQAHSPPGPAAAETAELSA